MISQPTFATMTETTNVEASFMFATSPKTHLYGGSFVSLGYQLLLGTFSGETSSPWTSPMSSPSKIPSGTSLMSVTQSTLPHTYPPSEEKQYSPYVSGCGHLQQPNPPCTRYPPPWG